MLVAGCWCSAHDAGSGNSPCSGGSCRGGTAGQARLWVSGVWKQNASPRRHDLFAVSAGGNAIAVRLLLPEWEAHACPQTPRRPDTQMPLSTPNCAPAHHHTAPRALLGNASGMLAWPCTDKTLHETPQTLTQAEPCPNITLPKSLLPPHVPPYT
jgi:hypothetical protein